MPFGCNFLKHYSVPLPNPCFRLPAKLYPEYHAVHQMMGGLCPRPGYQPLPQSHILEICPDNTVRVSTEDNQELVIKVSTEPRPSI